MDAELASDIMQALDVLVAQPVNAVRRAEYEDSYSIGDSEDLIVSHLEGTPFVFLGAGHFAAVFEHEAYPEYAFKLGFKPEDSGAMYAAWCRDTKLPNTPEIIHIEKFNGVYMVCMPKYIPSDNYEMCRSFNSEDCDRWKLSDDITHALKCVLEEGRFSSNYSLAREVLGVACSNTCIRIHTFFKGVAMIDMHPGNWMWSADGEIIITDPVSFSKCSS